MCYASAWNNPFLAPTLAFQIRQKTLFVANFEATPLPTSTYALFSFPLWLATGKWVRDWNIRLSIRDLPTILALLGSIRAMLFKIIIFRTLLPKCALSNFATHVFSIHYELLQKNTRGWVSPPPAPSQLIENAAPERTASGSSVVIAPQKQKEPPLSRRPFRSKSFKAARR
jgi:hypothetical protein